MNRLTACFICLILTTFVASSVLANEQTVGHQTIIPAAPPVQSVPRVIIYTLSSCPHCKAAKEYFTKNNIPFVNREVDTDSQHMDELMRIYDSMNVPEEKRGVPLILIGDSIKLQGFREDKVMEAIKKSMHK